MIHFKKYIFVLLLPYVLFAKAPSSDQIVHKMRKQFETSDVEKISFTEVYKWNMTGEEASVHGKLWLKGEDHFYVETDDQIIVSNGKTLWTYSKSANRVLIDNLSTAEGTILPNQILLQYTKQYKGMVLGEEVINDRSCYLIEFTPKETTGYIANVRMWIDKDVWLPKQFEQTDLQGNQTVFQDLNVELNSKVQNDLFQFTLKDDMTVLDMRPKKEK